MKNRKPKKLIKKIYSFLSVLIILAVTSLIFTRLTAKADTLIGFNEGSGTTVNDSEGNATGTITNANWRPTSQCASGTCLFFDGDADYVSFGDDADFDFAAATNFTIEFWFRTPDINTGTRVMVSKYNAATSTDGGFKVYMTADGKVNFGVDDDSTWGPDDIATSINAYDDNRWHHLVATKTGTTNLTLYVDALRVNQDVSISAVGTLANTDNLYVGVDGDGVASPYLGYLDELKIFTSTARSQSQVNTDYVKTAGINGIAAKFGPDSSTITQGLVGYWSMEGSGQDQSGSSNGVLNTGATYVGGKFGSGSEHVPASTQFFYQSSDKFDNIQTISFWANPDATTNYFFSLNTASIQAASGVISTTGLTNPKIYVNGEPSTTLTADTWQLVTVTSESLHNSETSSHHTDFPFTNGGAGPASDIYCVTTDDCKMAYHSADDSSLRFMDCDDATCTSGYVSILDGAAGCTLTGGDICDSSISVGSTQLSLYCPTATDCKISYFDSGNTALMFADCGDATCSTGSVEILDGMAGCGLSSGDACTTSITAGLYSSLICPSDTDCKIAYYDSSNTALRFADCGDATCSTGSVELVDGVTGCGLTSGDICDATISAGTNLSMDCPTATDCKISYYDADNSALMFADCDDATCSTGSVEILDGMAGCGLTSGDVCDSSIDAGDAFTSIACPTASNCKISYYDTGNSALMFADCGDTTCSTGSVEILDGLTGCGLTLGDGCTTFDSSGSYPTISCPASDNCKVGFYGSSQTAVGFADCDDEACSTGSIEFIDGTSPCLNGGDGCRSLSPTNENVSIFCLSATDCKLIYFNAYLSGINFADCSNETCTTGSVEYVESNEFDIYRDSDIYCLSATDCKMIYYIRTDTSVRFMDCDDATCSSGVSSIVDGTTGCGLTGGDGCDTEQTGDRGLSIYCPTTDDCKLAYNNGTDSALRFADCDDTACSTGSVENLDGVTGCSLTQGDICDATASTGYYPSIYCPTATNCKISYRDQVNSALMFADCDDATCSTGSVEILDGMTGCGLTNGDICDPAIDASPSTDSLYCPTDTDCKIAYYDTTNTALMFADCGDATCSTGAVEILDGATGCGLTQGDACDSSANIPSSSSAHLGFFCSATDCKVSYHDATKTALMFADCDDLTCSSGTVEILDGYAGCGLSLGDACDTGVSAGTYSSLTCPADDDCKVSYYDLTNSALMFADCGDATCSSGSTEILDGVTGCGLTGGDVCDTTVDAGVFYNNIYCPTAGDCKISYFINNSFGSNPGMFADCADATCSSGTVEIAYSGLPTTVQIGKVGSNYYDGTLDEVRVYNRQLSPLEIKSLYAWAPGASAHWQLDENTGTNASDTGAGGNDLTLTNSPNWAIGKFGSAVSFPGSDAHLIRADDSDFDYADDASFTISAWFKHQTASAQEIILSKYNEAGYKIIMESDGDITCALDYDNTWTPTDSATTTAATYDDGTWHYLSCVKNGAASLDLYIDGVLIISDSSLTATNTLTNSDPLYFGIDADGTSNDFTGSLDDLKIYNYVRTGQQIIEDMNAGHPAPGSPVGSAYIHYKFNENTVTVANNSGNSGPALNGTIANGTWSLDGKESGALSFANNTSVTATITDPGFTHSISVWVYPTTDVASKTLVTATKLVTDSSSRPTYGGCTGNALSLSTWTHILAVSNGSGSCAIYQNGMPTALGTTGVTFGTSLNIGGDSYTGLIDEFKLYTIALTSDQAKVDANLGMAAIWGFTSSYESTFTPPGDTSNPAAPVAYWPLDENTGSTAYDKSGNNSSLSSLSNNNQTPYTPGKHGSAAKFTPANENNFSAADTSTLSLTGDLTLEAWIKPSAVTAATLFTIAGKWDDNNQSYLLAQYGDEIRMYIDSVSNYATTDAANLQINTWYHVTATYNASAQTVAIYINGQLYASTVTGTIPASIGDDVSPFFLGAYNTVETLTVQPDETNSTDTFTRNTSAGTPQATSVVIGVKPGTSGMMVGLLKFDLSTLVGKTTTSRTLSLWSSLTSSVSDVTAGIYQVLSANSSWTEAAATWDHAVATTTRWAGDTGNDGGPDAGCFISGTDYSTTEMGSVTVAQSEASGTQHDISLDQTEFEDMVDANYGFAIVGITNEAITFHSSSSTTASYRPKLVVNYYDVTNVYNGLIDDVKLYDYVRTPAQIAWDFNRGAAVAWYKFDESSWTADCSTDTVYDSSSNALHADSCPNGTGQTTPETGKLNNAMHFDDSDDYVSVTDTLALDLTSGLTVSAWVKTDANEADNVIVSKGTSYEMGINADGDVYWDGVGAQVDDASTKVLTGTWHHVVVTNDDTTATYYVDGIKTGTSAAGVDADVATDLYIGYDGTNFFDGVIDDVRIYNYVLTPTQIKTLYNNNSAVKF